jgi:hypothetical protein
MGSNRRRGNGNYFFPLFKGGKKAFRIIYNKPGVMGTGVYAASTAYTHVVIYHNLFPCAVVTILDRACRYTGMTINTFILIN